MPKVPEEHLATRRTQIMMAALACTARKGFHQTTMRDICKEARLSTGAVYHYFKSKEEILAALTKSGREAKTALFAKIEACRNGRDAIRELFQLVFQVYRDKTFRTIGPVDVETYGEALRNEKVREIMLEELRALIDPIESILRGWQQKGEIRKDIDPLYLAHYLIAITVGVKIHLLVQRDLTVQGFESIVEKAFLHTVWLKEDRDTE